MDLAMDLLQDDDENIELWCLLGVGCMKQSPPDVDAAVYNFEHAKEMMDALKKEFGPQVWKSYINLAVVVAYISLICFVDITELSSTIRAVIQHG